MTFTFHLRGHEGTVTGAFKRENHCYPRLLDDSQQGVLKSGSPDGTSIN